MTVQSKLIKNADGTLTLASGQSNKIVKDLYDMNSKDKFTAGRKEYKGDSQFSHRVWGNQERMKEWLNHPDNTAWRTTKGKV